MEFKNKKSFKKEIKNASNVIIKKKQNVRCEGCKAKLMYSLTLEFTSHLLTSALPRDSGDPVGGTERERCSDCLGDLEV